jgi:hypothetical protein
MVQDREKRGLRKKRSAVDIRCKREEEQARLFENSQKVFLK